MKTVDAIQLLKKRKPTFVGGQSNRGWREYSLRISEPARPLYGVEDPRPIEGFYLHAGGSVAHADSHDDLLRLDYLLTYRKGKKLQSTATKRIYGSWLQKSES